MDISNNRTLDSDSRNKLLSSHPFFTALSSQDILDLAKRMTSRSVAQNEVIVREGDTISKIYLIEKGDAEVTRKMKSHGKAIELPVAVLHSGDAIGLSDEGFFSSHGLRTATVTSLTKMNLFEINLEEFIKFMNSPTRLSHGLKNSAEKMLRINFVKNITPFSNIPATEINQLMQHIEAISVQADSIIFKQGDPADKIYLLQSGSVQIHQTDADGNTKLSTILSAVDIFGEISLIASLPRNATARALEDSQLLSIDYKYFTEVMKRHDKLKQDLTEFVVDRRVPIKKITANILPYNKEGEELFILKNAEHFKYCILPEHGDFIWEQINGDHTIAEIIELCSKAFSYNAKDTVKNVLVQLARADFITIPDIPGVQLSWWKKLLKRWHFTT